jgi:hypothetical protein
MFENEHTFSSRMFASAQLLHNWHEQQPSSQGDFDSSVMGRLNGSGPASDFVFIL